VRVASSLQIEPLKPQEVRSALDVIRSCFDRSFHDAAEVDVSATFHSYPYVPLSFVAKDHQRHIGFVQSFTAYMHPNTYSVEWLCVIPEYRRHGVGRELLTFAERFVLSTRFYQGNGTFLLVSTIDCSYYERLGYIRGPNTHNGHPLMMKNVGKVVRSAI
jgi:GNAT superfamily N-acetyltransferase